jgi:putative membrane protein
MEIMSETGGESDIIPLEERGLSTQRTLILCIDGDDDIGKKANIMTPVVSRDSNIEAAVSLSLADPEEADANAMYGAVKLYDQLIKSYPDEVYQVATISGSSMGGVEADRKMVRELEDVIKTFGATGVILVTDGYSDEHLIPLIQSRIPITSIQHVVVKHSERLEETWAVIFRYFRMLVEDPYYSRVSLGVPGVMLIILAVLLVFDQIHNAGMMLSFVMGITLLIKGFGWDSKLAVMRLKLPPVERQLTLASVSVGFIISLVGIVRGVVNAWGYVPNPAPPWWRNFSWWLQISPNLIGHFLLEAIDFIILGAMVALIGGVAAYYMQKDSKVWQNVVGMIVTFWLRFIAIESAKVLIEPEKTLTLWSPLVFMTIAGVLTTILAVYIIYGTSKTLPFKRNSQTTP